MKYVFFGLSIKKKYVSLTYLLLLTKFSTAQALLVIFAQKTDFKKTFYDHKSIHTK